MAGSKPGERRGGRQKGVPNKANADFKAYAAQFTKEAMDKAVELMRTSDNPSVVLGAVTFIADRGHGKPTLAVDLKANVTGKQKIEHVIVDPAKPDR